MADGLGGMLDVIRIHQYGITQLTSGTGEAAEDENSLFVPPCGDKLLSHKIHPVVQGCHQAEVGSAVVTLALLVAVLPLLEDDGLPIASLETPVDSFRLGFDVGKQIVVALDV